MSRLEFDHIRRPFIGPDIENWRTRHGLSLSDATYALGLPNYKKKIMTPGWLDYPIELLMRLYDEDPQHGAWPRSRLSLPELFEMMYGDALRVFIGTELEKAARVDLQARFAKLFGRSKGRAYRWLDQKEIDASITNRTQEVVQAILGKLTQVKNPGQTLERLGAFAWTLRGEDLDRHFPIPTADRPPYREKRGRKAGSRIKVEGSTRRVVAPGVKIKLDVKHVPRLIRSSEKSAPSKAAKTTKRSKK